MDGFGYSWDMTRSGQALLEHVPSPALLVDQGQVTFANAAARELLGAHVVGENVRIAIRDPKALAEVLAPAGVPIRIDGLSVPGSRWQLTCQRLDEDKRLVLLEDLSVRVSVARAHADFVANASHELRTPLAAILGYVETLEDPKAGGDEAPASVSWASSGTRRSGCARWSKT